MGTLRRRCGRTGLRVLRTIHAASIGGDDWSCRDEVRRDGTAHADRARQGGRPAPRGEPIARVIGRIVVHDDAGPMTSDPSLFNVLITRRIATRAPPALAWAEDIRP